jgi:hypothetical protein
MLPRKAYLECGKFIHEDIFPDTYRMSRVVGYCLCLNNEVRHPGEGGQNGGPRSDIACLHSIEIEKEEMKHTKSSTPDPL